MSSSRKRIRIFLLGSVLDEIWQNPSKAQEILTLALDRNQKYSSSRKCYLTKRSGFVEGKEVLARSWEKLKRERRKASAQSSCKPKYVAIYKGYYLKVVNNYAEAPYNGMPEVGLKN